MIHEQVKSTAPDTLPIIAGELSLLTSCQLQNCPVGLPLGAAGLVVILYGPGVGAQRVGVQRGVGHRSRVLTVVSQYPGQGVLVILNLTGVETNEKDNSRVPLVLGDIEVVNVRVRTEAPEPEVHLLLLLTRAGHHPGGPVSSTV